MTILTDENYVDIAEKAILKLERNTKSTTAKYTQTVINNENEQVN